MELSGGSVRGQHILDSKMLLDKTFSDDASYKKGMYIWRHGVKDWESEKCIKIRIYGCKFSAANGEVIKFQTLLDRPIICGDIVYDFISDIYYLCTESFNIDDIHFQGKLTRCNWILRWQDKKGDIFEYPCQDMNSTQYNSGETSNRNFTIGTSQHILTLPYDENTVVVNSPQRFYLDKDRVNPTSFIVTQNDTTSYNYGRGLCKVTVTEHVRVEDHDRPDLGICDYRDDIKSDLIEKSVSCSQITYQTNIIKSGGSHKTFEAHFFDENGDEVMDGVMIKWDIICNFKSELIVEEVGNLIRISIDNDAYIDEIIKLVLSDENDNYRSSVLINIDSLL